MQTILCTILIELFYNIFWYWLVFVFVYNIGCSLGSWAAAAGAGAGPTEWAGLSTCSTAKQSWWGDWAGHFQVTTRHTVSLIRTWWPYHWRGKDEVARRLSSIALSENGKCKCMPTLNTFRLLKVFHFLQPERRKRFGGWAKKPSDITNTDGDHVHNGICNSILCYTGNYIVKYLQFTFILWFSFSYFQVL
jgi:hypothetical protein